MVQQGNSRMYSCESWYKLRYPIGSIDRDQNAAVNIAMLGARQLLGLSRPKELQRKRTMQEVLETATVANQHVFTAPQDLVSTGVPPHRFVLVNASKISMSSQASWIDGQRRSFMNWANNHLKKGRFEPIEDVYRDFDDGIKLIELLHALYRVPMVKYRKNCKQRIWKLDNLASAFHMAKSTEVEFKFLKVEHLADHDEKMILGMLWTLIVHYSINGLALGEKNAKEGLMKLVQSKIPECNIRNFTTDWADGTAFCKILANTRTGIVDMDAVAEGTAVENLETAFAAGEEHFEIPRLIAVEDIANAPKPDEKLVMMYLGEVFHVIKDLPAEDKCASNVSKFVQIERSIKEQTKTVESLAASIANWIEAKQDAFSSGTVFEDTSKEAERLQQLHLYYKKEVTQRLQDFYDLKAQYHALQKKLATLGKEPYVPPKRLSLPSLDAEWKALQDRVTIFTSTNKVEDQYETGAADLLDAVLASNSSLKKKKEDAKADAQLRESLRAEAEGISEQFESEKQTLLFTLAEIARQRATNGHTPYSPPSIVEFVQVEEAMASHARIVGEIKVLCSSPAPAEQSGGPLEEYQEKAEEARKWIVAMQATVERIQGDAAQEAKSPEVKRTKKNRTKTFNSIWNRSQSIAASEIEQGTSVLDAIASARKDLRLKDQEIKGMSGLFEQVQRILFNRQVDNPSEAIDMSPYPSPADLRADIKAAQKLLRESKKQHQQSHLKSNFEHALEDYTQFVSELEAWIQKQAGIAQTRDRVRAMLLEELAQLQLQCQTVTKDIAFVIEECASLSEMHDEVLHLAKQLGTDVSNAQSPGRISEELLELQRQIVVTEEAANDERVAKELAIKKAKFEAESGEILSWAAATRESLEKARQSEDMERCSQAIEAYQASRSAMVDRRIALLDVQVELTASGEDIDLSLTSLRELVAESQAFIREHTMNVQKQRSIDEYTQLAASLLEQAAAVEEALQPQLQSKDLTYARAVYDSELESLPKLHRSLEDLVARFDSLEGADSAIDSAMYPVALQARVAAIDTLAVDLDTAIVYLQEHKSATAAVNAYCSSLKAFNSWATTQQSQFGVDPAENLDAAVVTISSYVETIRDKRLLERDAILAQGTEAKRQIEQLVLAAEHVPASVLSSAPVLALEESMEPMTAYTAFMKVEDASKAFQRRVEQEKQRIVYEKNQKVYDEQAVALLEWVTATQQEIEGVETNSVQQVENLGTARHTLERAAAAHAEKQVSLSHLKERFRQVQAARSRVPAHLRTEIDFTPVSARSLLDTVGQQIEAAQQEVENRSQYLVANAALQSYTEAAEVQLGLLSVPWSGEDWDADRASIEAQLQSTLASYVRFRQAAVLATVDEPAITLHELQSQTREFIDKTEKQEEDRKQQRLADQAAASKQEYLSKARSIHVWLESVTADMSTWNEEEHSVQERACGELHALYRTCLVLNEKVEVASRSEVEAGLRPLDLISRLRRIAQEVELGDLDVSSNELPEAEVSDAEAEDLAVWIKEAYAEMESRRTEEGYLRWAKKMLCACDTTKREQLVDLMKAEYEGHLSSAVSCQSIAEELLGLKAALQTALAAPTGVQSQVDVTKLMAELEVKVQGFLSWAKERMQEIKADLAMEWPNMSSVTKKEEEYKHYIRQSKGGRYAELFEIRLQLAAIDKQLFLAGQGKMEQGETVLSSTAAAWNQVEKAEEKLESALRDARHMLLLREDTSAINQKRIKEIDAIFISLDKNKNGFINKKEFMAGFSRFGGSLRDAGLEQVFHVLAVDDELISRDEFLNFYIRMEDTASGLTNTESALKVLAKNRLVITEEQLTSNLPAEDAEYLMREIPQVEPGLYDYKTWIYKQKSATVLF